MITGRAKTRIVSIGSTKLDPAHSRGLYDHSPDGFNWGYSGSGPAQTALAILYHTYGREVALGHYQDFKEEFIATLPEGKDFEIDERRVDLWLRRRQNGGLRFTIEEIGGCYFVFRVRADGEKFILHENGQFGGSTNAKEYKTLAGAKRYLLDHWGVEL